MDDTTEDSKGTVDSEDSEDADRLKVEDAYRTSRRAVIHTVEVSSTFALHARQIVQQFRHGIYSPHIDFWIGDVSDWVAAQLELRKSSSGEDTAPFLDHVILDMAGSHRKTETVTSVMKDGASLITFVPSITQIGDYIQEIDKKQLPLEIERVLELGEGISNGRTWDVRLAQVRARMNIKPRKVKPKTDSSEEEVSQPDDGEAPKIEEVDRPIVAEDEEPCGPVLVCRPKVGKMTIGGGFVGLWRKVESGSGEQRIARQ